MSKLHGLEIPIPDQWSNETVYRFLSEPRDPAPALRTTAKAVRFTRASLLVSRYDREPGSDIARVFDAPNAEAQRTTASFRVVASGPCSFKGYDAFWQDTTRAEGEALLIFQRQIAVAMGPDELVLFTLTGDRPGVEEMATSLSLPGGGDVR